MILNKEATIERINALASKGEPFLFVTDFSCQKNIVLPLNAVNSEEILFNINGRTNATDHRQEVKDFELVKKPVSFLKFKSAFDYVHKEIELGNSYLTNLTFATPVASNYNLRQIFSMSKAKYKLWIKDQFVVFSPEIFIKIEGQRISSFPMKGTIDASLPNARAELLSNSKEMAEHVTIVDLIRNDMSRHAKNVEVTNFRYIDEVVTHEKRLFQVSSEITGTLRAGTLDNLGTLLFSLLPAGSITGAPKSKTLKIINEVEDYDRGYYTGVFGVFDGKNLDSGVMIRYIEQGKNGLIFKSGGGIHFQSDPASEYQELIDKVYVPIH